MWPIRLSHRSFLLFAAAALRLCVEAQGDKGSLTDRFPNMSAKERSRIAAKENEEAQKDATYQDVMQRAERAFQEGRYEEAINQYEEARAMRPYNVYPKVKIEDLRALLAKQAAKPDTVMVMEESHPVDPDPPVDHSAGTPVLTATPTPVPSPAPAPVTVTSVAPTVPSARTESITPKAAAASTPLKPAEGIIEQRYREGHAFVIERAVTVDGRMVKYKRVYHPYGATFYFEDGLAVDERVWNQRFPGK